MFKNITKKLLALMVTFLFLVTSCTTQVNPADLELRVSDNFVQYRVSETADWINVLSINDIRGTNGTNGTNGLNGIGVTSMVVNPAGELVVTYTDGRIQNLGIVVGAQGPAGPAGSSGGGGSGAPGTDGEDGVGISTAEINSDGDLVITLTNNQQINVGSVTPPAAPNVIIAKGSYFVNGSLEDVLFYYYEGEGYAGIPEFDFVEDLVDPTNPLHVEYLVEVLSPSRRITDLDDIKGLTPRILVIKDDENPYGIEEDEFGVYWTYATDEEILLDGSDPDLNLLNLVVLMSDLKGEKGQSGARFITLSNGIQILTNPSYEIPDFYETGTSGNESNFTRIFYGYELHMLEKGKYSTAGSYRLVRDLDLSSFEGAAFIEVSKALNWRSVDQFISGGPNVADKLAVIRGVINDVYEFEASVDVENVVPGSLVYTTEQARQNEISNRVVTALNSNREFSAHAIASIRNGFVVLMTRDVGAGTIIEAEFASSGILGGGNDPTFSGSATDFVLVSTPGTYSSFSKFELIQDDIEFFSALDAMRVGAFSVLNSQEIALFKIEYEDANGDPQLVDFEVDAYFDVQITDIDSLYTFMTSAMASNPNVSITRIDGVFSFELIGALAGLEVTDLLNTADFIGFVELLFTLDSTDEEDFTFDYSQDVDNSTTNPLEITSVSVFNTQVLETLEAEKGLEQLFNLVRDDPANSAKTILNLFDLKMDFDALSSTTTDFYPIKLYVEKAEILDNADSYNDEYEEMLELFGNSTTSGTEGVFVTAYDMFNALVFKAISDNSLSDLTNVKVLTVVLNDDTTEVDIYHNLTEFFGGVKTGLPSYGGGTDLVPSASVANFLGDLLQDTLNFDFSYDAASGQFTLVSKTPGTAASNILKIKDAHIPGLTKFLFNEDSNANVTDDDGAAAGMQVLSLSFDDKYFVSSSLEANEQLTIALPSVVKDNPSLSTTRTIGIINGTDSTIASSLFGSLALYAHTVYNDATTAQNNATAAIRTIDLDDFAKSLEVTFEEVMIFTIRNLYSQLILSLEPVFGFDNAFEFASDQAFINGFGFDPIKNLVELIGEFTTDSLTANELLELLVNSENMPYNEVMEFILQTMLNHQARVMEYISSIDLDDYTSSFYEMRQLEDLMLMEVVEDLDGFLSSWFDIEKYAASYQFYVDFEFVGGVGGLGNYIIHFTTDDHRYNDSNLSNNNFTTVDLNASRGEVVSSPALLKFIGLVPEVTSSEADTIRFDVPYDDADPAALEFDLSEFGGSDAVSDYVTTTILDYFSLSPRDVLLDGYITQFTFEFWDNKDTPSTGDDAVLQSFIFDINTLQAILESAEPTGTEAAATATVKHRPSPITPFTGTFDGYAGVDPVSELTLLNTLSNWKAFDLPTSIATYGLFGTLQDATVRNLVIENPMIQSESSNAEFGILAGEAINTVVHDVHIIDTLTPTSALDYESYDEMKHYPRPVGIFFDNANGNLGGLIGLSQGIVVSNVTVEVPVIGDFDDSEQVGGLIGFSSEQTIIYNSNVTSPLIVGYGDVGGFIGEYATEVGFSPNEITGAYYFIIENSFVITNFDVSDDDVGGFVGFVNNSNYFEMNIINSFAIINVVAEDDVGGFIGEIETDASDDDTLITIDNSYTIINDARNDDYLGGIYGEMDSSRFTKIYLNNVFTMIDNINSGAEYYGAIADDRDQALLIPKNVYFLNEITEDNVDEISISAISGFNRDFIGLNREQFEESFISDSSSKFLFKDLWDSSIWDFGGSGLEINAVLLDLDLPAASDITIPTLVSNPIINRALVRRSVEMVMSRELNSVVYTELETEGLSYFDITELALILPEFNQLIYGTQVVGEFLGDPITVEYDLASFESSGYRIDFEILVEDEATGAFTLTLDGTLEITLADLAIGSHRYVFLNRSGQNAQSDPALEPAGFSDFNSNNVFIITAANANSKVGIRPIISNDGFKTMITLDHVGDLADIYTFGNDPVIPN